MPFSGSVFTLPAGATSAAPGQIIQSAVWNAIHSDIQTGFTQVMSQLISEVSLRNLLRDNGDFNIWQRGAGGLGASISVAASNTAYTADRWYLTTGANQACTVSAVAALSATAPLAGKVQRTAGQTGITALTFGYPLTTDEIDDLRGNKLDISMIVKAGANWSPSSGTLTVAFNVGTGTPTKLASFTSATVIATVSTNLVASTNTAIALTSSIVVPATARQAELTFTWTPVGTAGTDDSLTIDSVQVEGNFSSVAWTPTNYDRLPFNQQLIGCKRFYRKTFPYATAPAQSAGLLGAVCALSQAAAAVGYQWSLEPEELFQIPGTVTTYNPSGASANWQDITTAVSLAVTVDTASVSNSAKVIYVQSAAASAAAHQILIHVTADAGI